MGIPSHPSFADPEVRRLLAPAALRTSRRIGHVWGLKDCEIAQLIGLAADEYVGLIKSPDGALLSEEQIYRAGLVIAIYGTLGSLFSPTDAEAWPSSPNNSKHYYGRSALRYMLNEGVKGMEFVLRQLQAELHGV